MASRLLSGLEDDLRSEQQDSRRLVVMARIASYYVRLGDSHRAAAIVEEIRAQPRALLGGEVLGWVNYVEGLIEHFLGRAAESRDKWKRAAVLAQSEDGCGLAALSYAWLSFSSYLQEDLSGLERDARRAIASNCLRFPEALARLSLTLALCLHYCGNFDKARKLYRRCHQAASGSGDEVEIAALIHDMAWMTTLSSRNAALDSTRKEADQSGIASSIESALSFEELVGAKSLPSLPPLLIAQDHILKGAWAKAAQLISENIESARTEGFSRLRPGLLADRALCQIHLGHEDFARRDASMAIESAQSTRMHMDDVAVFHSRLSEVFARLGEEDLQEEQCNLARVAWGSVHEFQVALLQIALGLDAELTACQ